MRKQYKRHIVLMISMICLVGILFTGCSTTGTVEDSDEASKDIFAMDTYMSFTAYGAASEEAVEEAAIRVQELDYLFTSENYNESGNEDVNCELYQLNEQGSGFVSDEMDQVLQEALDLNELTEGAFNPCMYVVMEAWGFPSQEYRVPDRKELESLLKLTAVENIEYDTESRYLTIKSGGTKLDLGGIVKGYTSEEIIKIFKDHGIESGLVNLGGNVQALGTKCDGSKWRVGIQDPRDSGANLGVVSVEDKAVITSGGYERYFEEDGETYHHIIDPETGYPVDNDMESVTIIAQDGTLADGLSTALFVMGCEKAQEFWKTYGAKYEFEILLVDKDFNLFVSEGLIDDFEPEEGLEVKAIKK